MSATNNETKNKLLPRHRLILLASAGILGAIILFAGPGGYAPITFPSSVSSARAADASVTHPESFADLVAKVKPAVISVRVKIDESAKMTGLNQNDEENTPLTPGAPMQKFFQQFGQNLPNDMQRHQMITGVGSGFFISADGYAVTNNHVVDSAKSVQVTTDDGTIYTAKVIGSDPKSDVALIKIDGKNDFPYVKFADQSPRVGDWVVAVGNPFGLGGTVTAGIVSASGRDIGTSAYDDYIQIDAPINKGNSGGPAFDVNGNVIGVNTAIYSPSGGSVGIGFDIPAKTVKMVVAQLKDKGYVTRGWLGVQIQPVTAGIADSLGMKKAQGALVDEPRADSPAAKAGLKSGDVITAINGTTVKDAREVARTIGTMLPNTSVKLDVLRNGGITSLTVALGQMPNQKEANAQPENQNPTSGAPYLGLQLAPANAVTGFGSQGVVVTGVDPNGPAAEQGIQTGNVILDVSGSAVASPGDVRKALIDAKDQGKHDVLMRLKAGDATKFVAVAIGQKAAG
jgi:serine protease Do